MPLTWNPRRVILVGDHRQLPATTVSNNAVDTRFARSLFERLVDGDVEPIMLEKQYRMHPMIRKYPSDTFYDKKI